MRVRILLRPTELIDGIALDHFRVGSVYELSTDVASLFLAEGLAEIVSEDNSPVFVRPPPRQGPRLRPLVLVVDDDADVRGLAESLLTTHGYEVVMATNGRDAIQRLHEHCPDLIMLDLNMPVMDGWQFRTAQRFLTEKKRAAVPVLLMTGVDDAASVAATLRAVGLVKKPIDPGDLLDAVSVAVAGAS
jgi:CheY-like chemotaxis protein